MDIPRGSPIGDILFTICEFLDTREILKYSIINKFLNKTCNNKIIWKNLLLLNFEIIELPENYYKSYVDYFLKHKYRVKFFGRNNYKIFSFGSAGYGVDYGETWKTMNSEGIKFVPNIRGHPELDKIEK